MNQDSCELEIVQTVADVKKSQFQFNFQEIGKPVADVEKSTDENDECSDSYTYEEEMRCFEKSFNKLEIEDINIGVDKLSEQVETISGDIYYSRRRLDYAISDFNDISDEVIDNPVTHAFIKYGLDNMSDILRELPELIVKQKKLIEEIKVKYESLKEELNDIYAYI